MSSKTYRLGAEAFLNATDEQLDGLARQTCFEMAFQVVMDTPVDTGFLRGSWQPSIGEAAVKANPTEDPSGFALQAEIAVVIAGMKAGDVFYMINNCEYGPDQEFGNSKMEGRFFIAGTVARFPEIAGKVAADLQMVA